MIAEQLTYSGIITKSRAMKQHILKEDDFEKIISFHSVSEVLAFLKEQDGYQELFRELDINSSRGKIEHELMHLLHLTYARLYRFANEKQKNTIRIYFYRFEIQALKICLQNIVHGEEEILDLSLFFNFFNRHSEINLEKALAANTIEGLMDAVRGTRYYAVIEDVRNLPGATLFDYETRLNIFYYEKLWKMKEELLSGREKKAFEEVFGKEIDLLNLLWIYRFKTYFDTDTGKILKSIIPIHYKLSKNLVSQMIVAENTAVLNELVRKSAYRKLFHEGEIKKEELERCQRKYIDKIYREYSKRYTFSIVPILFLLHLKEREIDKVTTAIECVRYQLPIERSLKILENL